MKVNLNLNKPVKSAVTFNGYKATKDDAGFKEYEFNYPFDEEKQDCYLEIYLLDKDRENNYFVRQKAYSLNGKDKIKIPAKGKKIDLAEEFGIGDNSAFAYHFIIHDKDNGRNHVRIDAGESIDERGNGNNSAIYNIVVPTKSDLSRGGAMKLVIIDSQKVGYKYDKKNQITFDPKLAARGEHGIKTIANKFGGTLAGLEHAIDNNEYDGYGRIISLPVFTDDDFSAHAYWNKNCMQIASSLGNINNYASLQRKMFAHGLNFVSDGAFVNEGLQGVHFKDLLKWGENSPYFNWFNVSSLPDNPLTLGVFGKYSQYTSHKIVNSPYSYSQGENGKISIRKNKKYNPKAPTYIQFFDTRLVSKKEAEDTTSIIKTYSKMSTDNVYKLHTHDDSVFPYAFEINPETYNNNIKMLNEYNSSHKTIKLNSAQAARMLSKFENFESEEKFESGIETWDANPDIAKLNFTFSNANNMDLENLSGEDLHKKTADILKGNYQVRDYILETGKYWTQKTDDILRFHIAQHLKNISSQNPSQAYHEITKQADGKIFPKSVKAEVSKSEVENVLNDLYNNKRLLSSENKHDQILRDIMDVPLDSIEFGDNIVSVLASPLVAKRAAVPQDLGKSKFDLYKAGNKNLPEEYRPTYEKMEEFQARDLYGYVEKVLNDVNNNLPNSNKLFDGDQVTEYGKYVLPVLVERITKYAVIKSLMPEAAVNVDSQTGEIAYDYNAMKNFHLQSLGITNPSSTQEEAFDLIGKMRKGLKNLNSSSDKEITESLNKTLKGTNLRSFQLADLIIDKTQSGLDWRIDATKDIANVEALRNSHSNFEFTWNQVIDFWKKFNDSVLKENPNAYLVAEVTDEDSLYANGYGNRSNKFRSSDDIIKKFLRETGMTSTANYKYIFTDIPKIFTKSFEDGSYFSSNDYIQKLIHDKFIGSGQYLKSGSLDSIIYSYTFIGNHDKPRALHCAALDLGMFYADLTYPEDYKHREMAYKMVNDRFIGNVSEKEVNDFDYSAISPKAIAMGYAIRSGFIDVLNEYKNRGMISQNDFDNAFVAISKSVSDLSQGRFMNTHFDPDAFGIKPIDVTIDMTLKQAKDKYHLQLPENTEKRLADDTFKKILDPAISKLLGIMKYLVALPGMPTLFDGDDAGATGYDTKTKNMYLQGRQRIHDEWLNPEEKSKYKAFIAQHKHELDEVMSLRKRPELNALNNGAVFMMPVQSAYEENGTEVKLPTILRQSTDGRMALSVFNTSGLHYDYRSYYSPRKLKLDAIRLNAGKDDNGKDVKMDGAYGVGLNGIKPGTEFINAKDPNDKYYVNEYNGQYFLKHGSGDGTITIDDSTLILYHVPSKTPLTFTGSNRIKPSYKFVAKAYANV